MTIIEGAPLPTRSAPLVLARRFLTGGVVGASLAAFVVAVVIESVPLLVTGMALPVGYGLLLLLAGAPRRAREAAVAPVTALAMIESLRAVGDGSSDVSVRFDLTVAPDDGPAFRVVVAESINLVDLPDYRPRGVLVVEYPPDRPWRARILQRPTPEWRERVAGASLDSAPGSALVSKPSEGGAGGLLALLGLLLGAAVVVLLFRTDLSAADDDGQPSSSEPSVSTTTSSSTTSSSSTTVVTSATGTVTLGPGQSMLDKGELRRAVASLTRDETGRRALTVVVQERRLSVVFAPTGIQAGRFDPRSLPFDRIPALVEQARTTLGAGSPQTWQLTAERLTGPLTIRVTVTGRKGTASLEADQHGTVVRRTPAG
ncbi:hypothetical protein [Streptomyces sp. NPDC047061]|uniref:hypothetical protein n=1 Tax=Streptomyces sp. NPDC047061 TaxID=3154605 RepID=UPI0033C05D7A